MISIECIAYSIATPCVSIGVDSVLVDGPANSLLMSSLSCSQVAGAGTVEARTVEAGTVEAGTVEAGTVEAWAVEAETADAAASAMAAEEVTGDAVLAVVEAVPVVVVTKLAMSGCKVDVEDSDN